MIGTAHNFEVEHNHSYFVGEVGVWVHNADYAQKHMANTGYLVETEEFTDPVTKRKRIRSADPGRGRDPFPQSQLKTTRFSQNIFQALSNKEQSVGDAQLPYFDSETGKKITTGYDPGHLYINRNGEVWDVTNMTVRDRDGGAASVFERLVFDDRATKPNKESQVIAPPKEFENEFKGKDSPEAMAPWLSNEQLTSLSKSNSGLVDRIRAQDRIDSRGGSISEFRARANAIRSSNLKSHHDYFAWRDDVNWGNRFTRTYQGHSQRASSSVSNTIWEGMQVPEGYWQTNQNDSRRNMILQESCINNRTREIKRRCSN